MPQPFRIAFVGIDHPHGAHWRQALRGVSSNIELTAIVPAFGGGTASLEERYADLPRFDTVEALIAAGEFDGAVVCLPNDVGPDAMIALARAGKHILAEKPVAGSGEDARQIAEAVGEGGIAFQNGYMWRYDEAVERLRRMVHDGSFGKLISVEKQVEKVTCQPAKEPAAARLRVKQIMVRSPAFDVAGDEGQAVDWSPTIRGSVCRRGSNGFTDRCSPWTGERDAIRPTADLVSGVTRCA